MHSPYTRPAHWLKPKLGSYVDGCMVSIHNTNEVFNSLPHRYQYCIVNQMSILCGYHKMKDFSFTQVIISFNIILNHIDIKISKSLMTYRPELY